MASTDQLTRYRAALIAERASRLPISNRSGVIKSNINIARETTSKSFPIALANSIKACPENILLIPARGLNRLHFGAKALPLITQPPKAIGPTTAAINKVANTGISAINPSNIEPFKLAIMLPVA